MSRVLVVAPHPDDETLGCGGTIYKHKDIGDELFWLIVTEVSIDLGWPKEYVKMRKAEIDNVSDKYGFKKVFNFEMPATKMDSIPTSDLIDKIKDLYTKVKPEIIYIPFAHDVHTDHQLISKAFQSTFKWFRYPFIKKVLMYETPSETEFNFMDQRKFMPNVFNNISEYEDKKINTMKIYDSEIDDFPFPRSEKNIRSLAAYRGSQSGYKSAEAFELIYERS